MRHLDLFSGIGGFALAAQSVWGEAYENVGFCDNEPFAQAILKKHWPDSTIYDDIKKLAGGGARGITADLITGGFPCQPFSSAGLRRGKEDDRHLWPYMLQVIRAVAPAWVIGENVGGFLTWNGGLVLNEVCADLEGAGYEVWPFVLPAVAVNAPHKRDRVWIIAHADGGADGRVARAPGSAAQKERLQKRHRMGEPVKPSKVRDVADANNKGYVGRGGGSPTNADRLAENEQKGQNSWGATARCGKNAGDVADAPGQRLCVDRAQKRLQSPAPGAQHGMGGQDSPDSPGERGEQGQPQQSGRVGDSSPFKSDRQIPPDADTRRVRRHKRPSIGQGTTPRSSWEEDWPAVAARLCLMDDGLPGGLVRPKGWRNAALKGAGNAIVPQVAAMIMHSIRETGTL